MRSGLSESKGRIVACTVVTFGAVLGLGLMWAPWAQAAGNVQVSTQDGDLIIQGDDGDNNIIITESGVAGRAGTTVNGQRHVPIPEGVVDDVDVRMRGGDDFVRIELPGTNFAIPDDLKATTGLGADTVELLQVKAPDQTRIETGDGNDVILIDGVFRNGGFIRPEFAGKFRVETATGEDLLEFHHAIFHAEVSVSLGSGIDGACSTEDSDFDRPDLASFNGGDPTGVPGDGFVSRSLEFTNIVGFEDFPDDCAFLGGRF